MSSVRDFYKRKLLAAKDLKPKQQIVGIISAAYPEDSEEKGIKVTKLIVELSDGDVRVSLNKGNALSLAKELGDDFDAWIGKKVRVFTIDTEFNKAPCKGLKVEKMLK